MVTLSGYTTFTACCQCGNGAHFAEEFLGNLVIQGKPELTSLIGLGSLTKVSGNFFIGGNAGLTSLAGLDKLTHIGGGLRIQSNGALASLAGLDNLTHIGYRRSRQWGATRVNLWSLSKSRLL